MDEEMAIRITKQIDADATEMFNAYWQKYGMVERQVDTDALLHIVRRAFVAGWEACVLHLLKGEKE